MSEQEPSMNLDFGNGNFEARRDNSSIWLHVGKLAIYDNVFLQHSDEESGVIHGSYIFSTTENWQRVKEFMLNNSYPTHANLQHVANSDLIAYNKMIENQLQDLEEIPDWLV